MNGSDSLLLPLFDYLRRHGVPLGVSEYLLVAKALREGMLQDSRELHGFCRLLWAKSLEDQGLFDLKFAQLVGPSLGISAEGVAPVGDAIKSAESSPPEPDQVETPEEELNVGLQNEPELTPIEGHDDDGPITDESIDGPAQVDEGLSDDVFVTNAALRPRSQAAEFYQVFDATTFRFTPRLPLHRRQMAGAWRQLRRFQRIGSEEELDLEGTIDEISQTGLFLAPKMQPSRRNQVRLVLMIDQQGSMAPFSPLIETLVEATLKGGLLGRVSLYYFHDCPISFVYEDSALGGAVPIEEVLSNQAKNHSVLIVSDAGAARGYYDSKRANDTETFLKLLSSHTYLYAWLNPMPAHRWELTTAEEISRHVPMYSFSRDGLNDAIDILRGRPFPSVVELDA